jgi:hypothetical protein
VAVGPSSRAVVKIYGERGSGTTWLERLIVRNLDVRCLRGGMPRPLQRVFPRSERVRDGYFRLTAPHNLGWKHALPPDAHAIAPTGRSLAPVAFVTISKNPYAWLLSLHRRPHHARRRSARFDAFLAQPWETVGRENAPVRFASPIDLWNRKNAAYLALGSRATAVHVRYEDLLRDPRACIEALGTRLCAPPRRPFANVLDATKRADRGRRFEDYRAYYLEERWREALDDASLRRINAELDTDLMDRLGYARIAG